MRILTQGNKAIDLETQAQICLCVHRQVRYAGPHWCKKYKKSVQDWPDCKNCIEQGRAP